MNPSSTSFTAKLNNFLNRFSMYTLVGISLSVLWLMAGVYTLTGKIDFDPLAFLVSSIVLVAATFLSNRLFGLLFGVRTHDKSSLITALILFFIFTPTLEVEGLLALALTGTIASASKYILAHRGRHIFNPAAVGAVVISLTGLAYATWWVATPSLLPATAVLAFLILYKTRRLQMGLIFLAIATPLVIIRLLGYDIPLATTLNLIQSWPLLFFVGFMLSEPLTLPAKKWQQLVEAALLAVLFALPFTVWSYTSTYALTLVLGNLLAFGFSRRRAISLTFAGSRQLTPTVQEFSFTPNKPLSFEPGQYMEVTIPHKGSDGRGTRRVFSITSRPGEPTVRFGVKFYEPSSSLKKALRTMPKNAVIQATGINGSFTLPKDTSQPLLFIAGGIGITPFISQLLHVQSTSQKRDIILIYSVVSSKELAYADVLQKLGVRVIVVSKSITKLPTTSWQLIQEPYLTTELLHASVPDIAKRNVYISGPPLMINSIKQQLSGLHVKSIKTDYFTGY